MKFVTLTLRKSIWRDEARRRVLNNTLNRVADKLEHRIKATIDNSSPAGRLYRRLAIKGAPIRGMKLQRVKGAYHRAVVGYKIHRASAPGQPPAKDTGELYRSISVKRINNISVRARVGVIYARRLDSLTEMNRPFFDSVVRTYYREEFKNDVRQIYTELL